MFANIDNRSLLAQPIVEPFLQLLPLRHFRPQHFVGSAQLGGPLFHLSFEVLLLATGEGLLVTQALFGLLVAERKPELGCDPRHNSDEARVFLLYLAQVKHQNAIDLVVVGNRNAERSFEARILCCRRHRK